MNRTIAAFACILSLSAEPLNAGPARPMTEIELERQPVARAARELVTHAAIGTIVRDPSDGMSRMGAVRPVTCVLLPGGHLLTAAHAIPRETKGTAAPYRDPVTGALRVDRRDDGLLEQTPLVVIVEELIARGEVAASDNLLYSAACKASQESAAADWALLAVSGKSSWEAPVSRVGTASHGERCWMVGYPASMLDPSLFEVEGRVVKAHDLKWVGLEAVVLGGTIVHAGRDRVTITSDGDLGAKARGLSGGGVFVERDGEPMLVGIVVQAGLIGDEVTACPLPRAVTELFGGDALVSSSPARRAPDTP